MLFLIYLYCNVTVSHISTFLNFAMFFHSIFWCKKTFIFFICPMYFLQRTSLQLMVESESKRLLTFRDKLFWFRFDPYLKRCPQQRVHEAEFKKEMFVEIRNGDEKKSQKFNMKKFATWSYHFDAFSTKFLNVYNG